jgi:hypothetical protein
MQLYVQNETGSPMTLQNVALNSASVFMERFAPGVLQVIPAGGEIQLAGWATEWDPNATIGYNISDGTVLVITYAGSSYGQINTSFIPHDQGNWEAPKSVIYGNCVLITVSRCKLEG